MPEFTTEVVPPLNDPSLAPAANGNAASTAVAARILVIDDEASIRESLEVLLSLEGYSITIAPFTAKRDCGRSRPTTSIWFCSTSLCPARADSSSPPAAVAVGLSCLGGGIAVGQIGAAAMAAMSENPRSFGPRAALRRSGGRNLPLGIHRGPDDHLGGVERSARRGIPCSRRGGAGRRVPIRRGAGNGRCSTPEEALDAFRAVTATEKAR